MHTKRSGERPKAARRCTKLQDKIFALTGKYILG